VWSRRWELVKRGRQLAASWQQVGSQLAKLQSCSTRSLCNDNYFRQLGPAATATGVFVQSHQHLSDGASEEPLRSARASSCAELLLCVWRVGLSFRPTRRPSWTRVDSNQITKAADRPPEVHEFAERLRQRERLAAAA